MKPSRRLPTLPVLAAALVCLSGCASAPLPVARPGIPEPVTADLNVLPELGLDPAMLRPSESVFHLGPGDTFEIEVMGDITSRTTVTVGPDGKIYYNILPGLDVWGLTLAEARDHLGDELKKFVRERPVVTLALRTVASKQVWVLGRLGSPGVYSLGRPTSLLDAVAGAGGPAVNTPAGGMYSERTFPEASSSATATLSRSISSGCCATAISPRTSTSSPAISSSCRRCAAHRSTSWAPSSSRARRG